MPTSNHPDANGKNPQEFTWECQAVASEFVSQLVDQFAGQVPFLAKLKLALLSETGTRLNDWVDHFEISPAFAERMSVTSRMQEAGFAPVSIGRTDIFENPRGLFPWIKMGTDAVSRIGLKVESVVDFLLAHGLENTASGRPGQPWRTARVAASDLSQGGGGAFECYVVEKHGCRLARTDSSETPLDVLLETAEAFQLRKRNYAESIEGFDEARRIIDQAIPSIGVNRTCDLFFAAERSYWQSRNHAARIQKFRQDRLGMGWANHDHHTYRSSRRHFADLISILEQLGFACRERFYAGAEAGWGAQVLEQPDCGLVVFADVDLSEEELAGDFAHDGLEAREQLGTVGLWCALHGEAFLEAGMHHLECQFDFNQARQLLKSDRIECMDPFTDFEFLKQCFTEPERWPVAPSRLEALVQSGQISAEIAQQFAAEGAVGSHLEILERNDGYKGFNQTGVSKIIAKTDPRKQTAPLNE